MPENQQTEESPTLQQRAEEKPRRRQARGERRIAQLLEAAASVFCRSGYTGASTNAIAREAGVSPGTLYQFFPNKEAIAVGLSDQLLEHWAQSHGQALAPENIGLPLDRMLDAILDPLIAFNVENPAFAVLMHGPDTPGAIIEEIGTVHCTLLARVEEMIATRLPDMPSDERTRTANMALHLFKAGLTLIMSHEGAERDAYVAELKTVMHRYLEPLLEGGLPAGR
ncbi:TetR family transcriptional regulator [Streptomyces rhizosphaerihabitans]|uniref:TetR family transcriptional regulator n=1 Tax=Streptomyces rhizosphaerihabitans TaxID=1266770 RepID=UPI0021C13DE9|nr:TetR family transcriptional regulator [Streptomyces rhizosphaerihabitans]MCT9005113.1 TetR family transcriptional regulator [Streptomyces rhizosphaerihabitans]